MEQNQTSDQKKYGHLNVSEIMSILNAKEALDFSEALLDTSIGFSILSRKKFILETYKTHANNEKSLKIIDKCIKALYLKRTQRFAIAKQIGIHIKNTL